MSNSATEGKLTLDRLIDQMTLDFRQAVAPLAAQHLTRLLAEEVIETKDVSDQMYLAKPEFITVEARDGKPATTFAPILTIKRVLNPNCFRLYYERLHEYDPNAASPFALRTFTHSESHNIMEEKRFLLEPAVELEVQRQLKHVFAKSIATNEMSGFLHLSVLEISPESLRDLKEKSDV